MVNKTGSKEKHKATWTGPTLSARRSSFISVVTGDRPSTATMFGMTDVAFTAITRCTVHSNQLNTTKLIHQHSYCVAQLTWKCVFMLTFFGEGNLTSKVRRTNLVFVVRSRFISRSVHTRLQVSACNSYNLCALVNIKRHTHRIWSAYMNSSARWPTE